MIRQFTSAEFLFLVSAVRWTLLLSAIAFAGGATLGLMVALARTAPWQWLRATAGAYILVFQGTPLLMQLFLVFFGVTLVGASVDLLTAAAIGLTSTPPPSSAKSGAAASRPFPRASGRRPPPSACIM